MLTTSLTAARLTIRIRPSDSIYKCLHKLDARKSERLNEKTEPETPGSGPLRGQDDNPERGKLNGSDRAVKILVDS